MFRDKQTTSTSTIYFFLPTQCKPMKDGLSLLLSPSQVISKGKIKNIDPQTKFIIHTHSVNIGTQLRIGDDDLDADAFTDYLKKECKLNINHVDLEIAACNSNFFIPDLYDNMVKSGYRKIKITGYKGKLNLVKLNGSKGFFTAGLYDEKDMAQVEPRGHFKGITADKFDSDKHRVEVNSYTTANKLRENNIEELKKVKEHYPTPLFNSDFRFS